MKYDRSRKQKHGIVRKFDFAIGRLRIMQSTLDDYSLFFSWKLLSFTYIYPNLMPRALTHLTMRHQRALRTVCG